MKCEVYGRRQKKLFARVTNINFRKDTVSVRDPNINEFITTLDVHSNIMTPMRRSFITVGPK